MHQYTIPKGLDSNRQPSEINTLLTCYLQLFGLYDDASALPGDIGLQFVGVPVWVPGMGSGPWSAGADTNPVDGKLHEVLPPNKFRKPENEPEP